MAKKKDAKSGYKLAGGSRTSVGEITSYTTRPGTKARWGTNAAGTVAFALNSEGKAANRVSMALLPASVKAQVRQQKANYKAKRGKKR